MKTLYLLPLLCVLLAVGCASTNQVVLDGDDETQLQKRSYQSRTFNTSDKKRVLRATISTLQDLGFIIDRADLTLGSVSGTRFDGHQIKMTVSVRPRGGDRMVVRANAQFNTKPIKDPGQYQNFFTSLEKSLFLAANAGE